MPPKPLKKDRFIGESSRRSPKTTRTLIRTRDGTPKRDIETPGSSHRRDRRKTRTSATTGRGTEVSEIAKLAAPSRRRTITQRFFS